MIQNNVFLQQNKILKKFDYSSSKTFSNQRITIRAIFLVIAYCIPGDQINLFKLIITKYKEK